MNPYAHTSAEGTLPLVTIVVVTYNSAEFVNETLASISAQDYEGPLQVIVSDDGSTDDTLAVARSWADIEVDRFSEVAVIKTPHNLGIVGNYNFALRHVKGEWVKYIAGDDRLRPDCISKFVEATKRSSDKFFICEIVPFDQNGFQKPRLRCREYFKDADAREQESALAGIPYLIEGPTLFIHKPTLEALGGYDEKYPLVEDWPTAMKFVYNGYRIEPVDFPLVEYREHQSVSKEGNPRYKRFWKCWYGSVNDWRMKIAARDHRPLDWWHAYVQTRLIRWPDCGVGWNIIRKLLMLTDVKRVFPR
ncbi:MAG: glycosyltransferase [Candidatus Amulumruptor caecigallinarius]|nr:glycosyltransferase [Candidatus Amulumruptor caecigallinarius]MCM1396292.1 glycosyltransferase [Candidatus Amulumruptor caecigallinarius]MCM1454286.1 glycosyltransferase [bacterium]